MLNIQICGETQQQYLQKKSFEHKTSFSVPPGRYLRGKCNQNHLIVLSLFITY